MKKTYSITAAKGFLIGATMIIPGVSGGTMAMLLGIYDELIHSISSFQNKPKKSALFLTVFSVSGILGMMLFSTPLSILLETYPMETLYFFLGAVFGGIPVIEKKSGIGRFSFDALFFIFLGLILVLSFSSLPEEFISVNNKGSSLPLVFLIVGLLSSVALILPGISFSHFILILGLYQTLLEAIHSLQFTMLVPLGVGILGGIVLFTKGLDYIMNRYPKQTYLVILGFILGSAAYIFPGIPTGWSFFVCMFLAVSGFWAVYRM